MCFPTLTAVGSLFLLFSFIIELFILIGNRPSTFLPNINFAKIWNRQQDLSYTFGLWYIFFLDFIARFVCLY